MNFKSKLFIFLIILSVMLSVACVSAADDNQTEILSGDSEYHSFDELNQSISESVNEVNLNYSYKYDEGEIEIYKEGNFTINGNDHEIVGVCNSKIFDIESDGTVTINNLTFRDCLNSTFAVHSNAIFNNVKFVNCSAAALGFMSVANYNATFNNCIFQMKSSDYYVISVEHATLFVNNSKFEGGHFANGLIYINRNAVVIENTTFDNITSNMATAINFKGYSFTIKKSKFRNLHAILSGGAFLGKFFPDFDNDGKYRIVGPFIIEDCEFANVTSGNDGGVFYFDMDSAAQRLLQPFDITNTIFTDCQSRYGGAISALGGILNIVNSTFKNNRAGFEGGAIYTSWSHLNIVDSVLSNNSAEKNAGAIYFDKGNLTIKKSNLTGNKVIKGSVNGIYANDVNLDMAYCIFDNGGIGVYANFLNDFKSMDITMNGDIFSLDNKDYIVSVESPGIKINLINNEIDVDKLPSRFYSRDFGWTTPIKLQGDNFDCWAFSTISAIETALLKATGVAYNLSENYVQKLQLKYTLNGDLRNSLTGFDYSGLGYALSWYGVLPMDAPYDDRGMIADTDFDVERIHVQDAMFIYGGRNDTMDLIKWAIIKYGAVSIHEGPTEAPDNSSFDGDDIAIMDHSVHFVALIGWNDNFTDNIHNISMGVWLTKDSLANFALLPYNSSVIMLTDYYSIVPQNTAIAYIFENTVDYHVNYQTDLTGLTGFDGNYTIYSNEFTSKYDELIGAVGTYFNESGINYSFDVYVNGKLMHSQTGVSEFAGFRTIVLNKYIPVKAGDKFKVVFKSNALPYQAYSRQHYVPGMSFVSKNGNSWEDLRPQNKTVCLKVYTVRDDTKIIDNKDITVDYTGESYFSVRVVTADGRAVGAGKTVTFSIGGKTYYEMTDNNGVAKIKITQLPKKYTVTISYNGKTYKNTVTVKQVVTASKITIKKKTAKKLVLKAKLKINGKLVKGKTITFKFKGKTYKVKTNKKGIAQKTLKKKVIKKLKKGKKYTVKITYAKTTIKTTVKVK